MSRCILALVFVMGSALSVRAQDTERLPSVELPPEIERVLRDYEKFWAAGQADSLAALFTEDGFVLSSSRPPVRGRTAITNRYANAGGNLMLRAMSFEASGNIGYVVGGYTYSPDGVDIGKFILALRQNTSGRWLIAADMDNSNASAR